MKIRAKHTSLTELIGKMDRASPAWAAVAKGLNRPSRRRHQVNCRDLERLPADKTLVVPGKVLGTGDLTKKVTVAALSFSGAAREKIEKAGGQVLDIEHLFAKDAKGKGIQVIA